MKGELNFGTHVHNIYTLLHLSMAYIEMSKLHMLRPNIIFVTSIHVSLSYMDTSDD